MALYAWVVAAFLLLVAGLAAWVRLAPLPGERLSDRPGPSAPGRYPMEGGYKVVIAEAPADAEARLREVALASARTVEAGEGTYVTRSAIWGFPDITRVWRDGAGALHVYGHLVVGRADLDVNRKRVSAWLQRAGLEGAG